MYSYYGKMCISRVTLSAIMQGNLSPVLPDGVYVYRIEDNPYLLDFTVILGSTEEVHGWTYKVEQGCEIPLVTGRKEL